MTNLQKKQPSETTSDENSQKATDDGGVEQKFKAFKVFRVSENTNSFGLRGHFICDREGNAWEFGASYMNEKPLGTVWHMRVDDDGVPLFAMLGLEIPRKYPPMPAAAKAAMLKEIWDIPVPAQKEGVLADASS